MTVVDVPRSSGDGVRVRVSSAGICGSDLHLIGADLGLPCVNLGHEVAGVAEDGRPVAVRFRQGGERCRPAGRSGSQTLKKLLQEYEVPPWWRDRTPLLYCGDELVAVADLWVCEGWQSPAAEQGLVVTWRLGDSAS